MLFKNNEKCFLFQLNSSFRSQDIYFFLLCFFGHEFYKVNFKIYDVTTWLTNNYKHILPYISQSKGNKEQQQRRF